MNLLSPDCRDENHQKCDGTAWNLETDALDACGCGCGCTTAGLLRLADALGLVR
jgi:hypothetical protein